LSISKLILIFGAVTDTQAYNVATSPYTPLTNILVFFIKEILISLKVYNQFRWNFITEWT